MQNISPEEYMYMNLQDQINRVEHNPGSVAFRLQELETRLLELEGLVVSLVDKVFEAP